MLSSKQEEEEEEEEEEEGNDLEVTDNGFMPCDEDNGGGHVGDEHSSDCTSRIEDDETCVYSLEKLLSFQALSKLCGDIQKLKYVSVH